MNFYNYKVEVYDDNIYKTKDYVCDNNYKLIDNELWCNTLSIKTGRYKICDIDKVYKVSESLYCLSTLKEINDSEAFIKITDYILKDMHNKRRKEEDRYNKEINKINSIIDLLIK